MGLNVCQGSSCLLSRGADTSKVSAASTFPHAAGRHIPGQSGDQCRGIPEVSIWDAIPPPCSPQAPGTSCQVVKSGHHTCSASWAFGSQGLHRAQAWGPRDRDMPLKLNAFSKALSFFLVPSADLISVPCHDPWEMCGGVGDACLSLVLPRGTWGKGVTPT